MFEQYLTKTGKLSSKQPQQVKNLWYINKFREKHGDTYDYSLVDYTGNKELVTIICIEHGEFLQTPHNHQKGRGCPKCQNISKQKTTQQCIEDFKQVHGSRYGYQSVEYTNNEVPVSIACLTHGPFQQRPKDHLEGKGCPKCANQNQNTLYLLKCNKRKTIKIGITNNLPKRIQDIGGSLQYIHHITVDNPRNLETQLHKKYQAYNEFNPTVNNGGTEFFKLTDQQLYELIQYLNSF